jgi:hypothetical protein
LLLGSRTIKSRLITPTLSDSFIFTINKALDAPETAWVRDDATKAGWGLSLNSVADSMFLSRVPPAGGADAIMLSLDNAGNVAAIGPSHKFGTRLTVYSDATVSGVFHNWASGAGYDNTKATWQSYFDHANDYWFLTRNAAVRAEVSSLGDLHIFGGVGQKATGTTWTNPSDPRLKRDVAPYARGLSAILALEPISFFYNGKGGTTDDGRQCYGYDAGAVQAAFPEAVDTRRGKLDESDGEETDILTLDTSNFTLALVNAVKELTARVAALEARLAALDTP